MKFQIPNIHHSKVNRRTHAHTDRQTDRQTDKPKAICPSNFFKVGGIKMNNRHRQEMETGGLRICISSYMYI